MLVLAVVAVFMFDSAVVAVFLYSFIITTLLSFRVFLCRLPFVVAVFL